MIFVTVSTFVYNGSIPFMKRSLRFWRFPTFKVFDPMQLLKKFESCSQVKEAIQSRLAIKLVPRLS